MEDIHTHAQQIYSMLLAAIRQKGDPMPRDKELENLAGAAIVYARAFARVASAEQ